MAGIFEVLAEHGVPFVVIGGHAVGYHGYVRATEDHDVVFVRSPAAERALLAALKKLNAEWISDEIDPATGLERLVPVSEAYISTEHVMMLRTDLGYLDIFDHIPGYPCKNTRLLHDSAEVLRGIRFANLEWLRRMKQAGGRPKDLEDLKRLAD
ncbi:MAG TPA: hypothetical protein DCM87_19700 [Planctomycetes bacterium]|nr:hypothetical protein [Planctomycetota bacterium]